MEQTGKAHPAIINGKYKVGNHLGKGAFGVIYSGISIETQTLVAIKFEPLSNGNKRIQLHNEARIYRQL